MASPEQRLWARLKSSAPPGAALQRIENRVGSGMPDVLVVFGGRAHFVELKAQAETKRRFAHLRCKLRAAQSSWLRRYSRLGISCGVLVSVGRSHFYLPGDQVERFELLREFDVIEAGFGAVRNFWGVLRNED
jgi:hypothetical protein